MPGSSNRLRLTATTALRERFETSYVLPRVPAPTLLLAVITSTIATSFLEDFACFFYARNYQLDSKITIPYQPT